MLRQWMVAPMYGRAPPDAQDRDRQDEEEGKPVPHVARHGNFGHGGLGKALAQHLTVDSSIVWLDMNADNFATIDFDSVPLASDIPEDRCGIEAQV